MMHLTDAAGLLGNAVAIVVLASHMPLISRLVPQYRTWLQAVIFLAVLVPAGDMPLAGYLRGAIGDLSVTTLVLLCASLLRMQLGWPALPGRGVLLLAIAVVAAGFYPLALGWGEYDPYRLGYGSYGLLACLLALALLAAWKGWMAVALAIAAAVLAWCAGWYESSNLWDYLLDPLVSVYAAGALAVQGVRRLRRL